MKTDTEIYIVKKEDYNCDFAILGDKDAENLKILNFNEFGDYPSSRARRCLQYFRQLFKRKR